MARGIAFPYLPQFELISSSTSSGNYNSIQLFFRARLRAAPHVWDRFGYDFNLFVTWIISRGNAPWPGRARNFASVIILVNAPGIFLNGGTFLISSTLSHISRRAKSTAKNTSICLAEFRGWHPVKSIKLHSAYIVATGRRLLTFLIIIREPERTRDEQKWRKRDLRGTLILDRYLYSAFCQQQWKTSRNNVTYI